METNSIASSSHWGVWVHQVKRVADVGVPGDSRVVGGLVFRKNVVHKLMRTHITQPRIMMLGSMLEYHRTSGKLSSFDTLLEQVNCSSPAASHAPLMSKPCSNPAQALLMHSILLLLAISKHVAQNQTSPVLYE